MGCGASHASAPDAVRNTEEWQLWNALDLRDEHEQVHLAVFLNDVYDLAVQEGLITEETRRKSWKEKPPDFEKTLSHEVLDKLEVPVDYTGIHLPQVLTEAAVKDLLDTFQDVDAGLTPLHHKYVVRIISEATALFRSLPNVTYLEKPKGRSKIVVVGDLHGHMKDFQHILRVPRCTHPNWTHTHTRTHAHARSDHEP